VIDPIKINRVPALTLWAAIVAERLGFDRDEALTLVRAVAGLNAYSKGVRLSGGEGAAQEGEEGGRVSDRAFGPRRPGGADAQRHPRARQGQAGV